MPDVNRSGDSTATDLPPTAAVTRSAGSFIRDIVRSRFDGDIQATEVYVIADREVHVRQDPSRRRPLHDAGRSSAGPANWPLCPAPLSPMVVDRT